MRLGTRQKCIGGLPRVSGACQDGTREFTKRRPRLTRRLSGVVEKLAESCNGLVMDVLIIMIVSGQGLDDAVGAHRAFARISSKVSERSLGTRQGITGGRPSDSPLEKPKVADLQE
ncbi:hypothetical protein GW17_00059814 [Ensete ventricosum]|nr:hypothetical protein GW17_00059814 [Ensete ventricosum]